MIPVRCVIPLYENVVPIHPPPCHQALHVLGGSAERLLRFDALRQCWPAFGLPTRSRQPGVPHGSSLCFLKDRRPEHSVDHTCFFAITVSVFNPVHRHLITDAFCARPETAEEAVHCARSLIKRNCCGRQGSGLT